MSRRALHQLQADTTCLTPLDRLLTKLAKLPAESRRAVWSAYRICRRFVCPDITEKRVLETARQLASSVRQGAPYAAVALGLKLSQAYTRMLLRKAGRRGRQSRAHAQEGYHLLRQALRANLGYRDPDEHPCVLFGEPATSKLVQAWCDASVRNGAAAAAVVLCNEHECLMAQASQHLGHAGVIDAELAAARLALHQLSAHGIRRARLNTDSQGVLRAFQGRLALKYCVEEAELLQLAQRFTTLEVRLIPRAFNACADALASAVLVAQRT